MNRSHHKDIDNHHHHRPQQNGTYESRPYHYHHPYNRYKLNGLSSEFELSTDTDDDSLVGEADSSNYLSPLDTASEALKDADQKDRDKVLNIIKMLLQENLQISLKNAALLRDLQRKDDEIAELLLQATRRSHPANSNSFTLTSCRSDTSSNSNDESTKYPSESEDIKIAEETIVCKSDDRTDEEKDSEAAKAIAKCTDSITISAVLDTTKAKAEEPSTEFKKKNSIAAITVTKTVIEVGTPKANDAIELKPQQPITNGTTTISSTKFGSTKSETEVIRMPLKKSVRRTPTDDTTTTAATVVVMQPHKLRDEARDKCDKLDKISRNFEKNLRSLSPPPSANLVTAKATE